MNGYYFGRWLVNSNPFNFQETPGKKLKWEETLWLKLEDIFSEKRGGHTYPTLPSICKP
jgi:hypothetical protein